MRTSINVSVEGFDILADIGRVAHLIETLPNTLAQAASDFGEPAVKLAAREARGTLSMSHNKGMRGYSQLDVLAIVRPGTPHAETEIVAVPRGAWHLVEYGARAHEIKVRPRSGFQAMGTQGFRRGAYDKVNHPGTAGTGVWTTAMANAEPVIDEAVQRVFDETVVNPQAAPGGAI